MFNQAFREALVILGTATILALVVYAVRPDKIAVAPPTGTGGPAQPATGAAGPPATPLSMPREISLDRAKALFDDNGAIFVDARHPVDFAAGHIRDARNLLATNEATWLSAFIAATDSSRVIITYCDGENCHLAPELAELLYFNGFDNVYYLKNGLTQWRQHGFPVATSPP